MSNSNEYLNSVELIHKFFENARGHDVRHIRGQNPCLIRVDGHEMYIYIKNLSWAQLSNKNPDNWRIQLPILRAFEEIKRSDKLFILLGYDKTNHVYSSWNPYWCKQRLNVGKSVSLYSRYSLQETVGFVHKIKRQELQNDTDVVCIPERQIYQYITQIKEYYPEETTYVPVGSSIQKRINEIRESSIAKDVFESFLKSFNKSSFQKYLKSKGLPVYFQQLYCEELEKVFKFGFFKKNSDIFIRYNNLLDYKKAIPNFISTSDVKNCQNISQVFLRLGLEEYIDFCISKKRLHNPFVYSQETENPSSQSVSEEPYSYPIQEEFDFLKEAEPEFLLDEYGKLVSLDDALIDDLAPLIKGVDFPDYEEMIKRAVLFYPKSATENMLPTDWENLFSRTNWKKRKIKENVSKRQGDNLRVTYPDGRVIEHKKASDTYVEVIESNFPDLIAEIDFKKMVITKEKMPDFEGGTKRNQVQLSTGHWLSKHFDTNIKAKILQQISDELDLGLKIEVFESTNNSKTYQPIELQSDNSDSTSSDSTIKKSISVDNLNEGGKNSEEIDTHALDLRLEKYKLAFSSLSTSMRLGRKAPHKAVLLLTIIQMYEDKLLQENKINFDGDLEIRFLNMWEGLLPNESIFKADYIQPFWYMQTESFWHIVAYKEYEKSLVYNWNNKMKPSNSRMKKMIDYAKLDERLYSLLSYPEAVASLKKILLDKYIDAILDEPEIDSGGDVELKHPKELFLHKLGIGDVSSNGQITIIDEDRLCYLVLSISRGARGLRTISKSLLKEFVDYLRSHPNADANELRYALSGTSDIDKYEYGYASTLYVMAKMVLGKDV